MNAMIMWQIVSGVDTFLNILSVLLLVYALMSWFMRPDSPIYVFLARLADPLLAPFRPISRWLINQGFRIDVSVILALFAIRILRTILPRLLYGIF